MPAANFRAELDRLGERWKQIGDLIDAMPPDEIERHFADAFRDNPKFRESVEHSVIAGYPDRPVSPSYRFHFNKSQGAILSLFVQNEGDLPFLEARKASSRAKELLKGPSFIRWLEHQEIPERTEGDLEVLSAEILRRWEIETSRRLQPAAAEPSRFLSPELESVATFAFIGRSQYVSTADRENWVQIAGPGEEPALIPRWQGESAPFLEKMGADRPRQELPLAALGIPAPTAFIQVDNKSDAPVINTMSGISIFRAGSLERMLGDPQEGLIQSFIDAGSWGYHVTVQDRLALILKKGWLTGASPTNPTESSRYPGLHLSVLLGVTYGIPGETVVIRVPMNRQDYRAFPFSPYFGHVIRDFSMSTQEVSELMQFSPDNGISWYPMKSEFLALLEKRLLPVFRGIPK